MTDSFTLTEALKNTKPIEQEGETLHCGDENIEQEIQENINEIDEMEETISQEPIGEKSRAELVQELLELNEIVKTSEDKMKRALAEHENIRRRRDIDVQNAYKFSIEKFTKELLPVIDSLEMAISATADEKLLEGIQLTHKMFLDALKKSNIEQIDPTDQPFNPEHHQAMSQIPAPDQPANTVMQVMQKGYTLNDRLIRPALVIVSKK